MCQCVFVLPILVVTSLPSAPPPGMRGPPGMGFPPGLSLAFVHSRLNRLIVVLMLFYVRCAFSHPRVLRQDPRRL